MSDVNDRNDDYDDDDEDFDEDDEEALDEYLMYNRSSTFSWPSPSSKGGGSTGGLKWFHLTWKQTELSFYVTVKEKEHPAVGTGSAPTATSASTARAADPKAPEGQNRNDDDDDDDGDGDDDTDIVGYMKGSVVERPDPNFFSLCDEESQELQELAVTFCDRNGVANRVNHSNLKNNKAAKEYGGFLHIDIIEVNPTYRGQDLGLRIIHETLNLIGEQWSLAVMKPSTLTDSCCRWSSNAGFFRRDPTPKDRRRMDAETQKLARHFARLGFCQAPKTDAWFLTLRAFDEAYAHVRPENIHAAWLSKEKSRSIKVWKEPQVAQPTGLDKYLADRVKVYSTLSNPLHIQEIVQLVANVGASIHKSGSLQIAAANHDDFEVLDILIELGGDINAGDSRGNTPMHVTSSLQRRKMVEYLVSKGAQSKKNKDGKTPLDLLRAAKRRSDDIRHTFGLDAESDSTMSQDSKRRRLENARREFGLDNESLW